MIGFLIQLTALTLILAAICLALYLISEIRKQRRSAAYRLQKLRRERRLEVDPPRESYRRPTVRLRPKPATYFTPPTYTASAARLETKLLGMLGNHQQTAIRLLVSVRQKYPGRDERWHLEKAIRDLERDRR